jgi:exoribonuclease R
MIGRQFFTAEYTGWNTHEQKPYCKIIEFIGSILDKKVYITTLLKNQGISEEMYPGRAIEEAKKID